MSERELQRVEVLSGVIAGRRTVVAAAAVLGLSRRQVHRLLTLYRSDGAMALRHKARGRRSNRALSNGLRELALGYVRESYADFGPTLAAEMLRERHGLTMEPVPDRTMYQEVQFDWWHKHASGEAQAIQLLGMLNLKSRQALNALDDDGEEDGISLTCQFYNTACADERGVERLRAAIQQQGLNIEIVETT